MIEALTWPASPGLLTAGHHQGEPVTMIEVLIWQVAPGLLTAGQHRSPDGGMHQGEPVTMIEVLIWQVAPGVSGSPGNDRSLDLASIARPVDRWPPPRRTRDHDRGLELARTARREWFARL